MRKLTTFIKRGLTRSRAKKSTSLIREFNFEVRNPGGVFMFFMSCSKEASSV